MYHMINITNTALCYMRNFKTENPQSSHQKEKTYFFIFFSFVFTWWWMFTKLTVVIISWCMWVKPSCTPKRYVVLYIKSQSNWGIKATKTKQQKDRASSLVPGPHVGDTASFSSWCPQEGVCPSGREGREAVGWLTNEKEKKDRSS